MKNFEFGKYMSRANSCWGVWTPINRPVVSRINDEYYLHETAAVKISENPISDAFSRAKKTEGDTQVEVNFPVLQEQLRNPAQVRKENKQMMETQEALKSEWRRLLFISSVRKVETVVFGVASRWMSSGSTKVQLWPKQRHRHGYAHQSNEKQWPFKCDCSSYCQNADGSCKLSD